MDALNSAISGQRIPFRGFAARDGSAHFENFAATRHAMGKNDILIDVLYAGICHSDIHTARGEWGECIYPIVPGHEIVGRVIAIGKDVHKFKLGELAGVGCMVNSCGKCLMCKNSQEQYCENGKTIFTYNSYDTFHDNEPTHGGYSDNIVVSEAFAVKVSADARIECVAPLLCAGITTYSPLRFSGVGAGMRVGIAGFGGLGVMALKYALAFGAECYIFARNKNKESEALEFGAKALFDDVKQAVDSDLKLDFIISTIPANYDLRPYINLLKFGGEFANVGMPPHNDMPYIPLFALGQNRRVYGSMIGGIKETQEMLDFSIAHNIYPEVEIIKASADAINKTWDKLLSHNGRFRYVIDMKTLGK